VQCPQIRVQIAGLLPLKVGLAREEPVQLVEASVGLEVTEDHLEVEVVEVGGRTNEKRGQNRRKKKPKLTKRLNAKPAKAKRKEKKQKGTKRGNRKRG
jgi:hypothetical protein